MAAFKAGRQDAQPGGAEVCSHGSHANMSLPRFFWVPRLTLLLPRLLSQSASPEIAPVSSDVLQELASELGLTVSAVRHAFEIHREHLNMVLHFNQMDQKGGPRRLARRDSTGRLVMRPSTR